MTARVLPYGAWPSPLAAGALTEGAVSAGEVRVDADDVWWSEARPAEGGRIALRRRRADGTVAEVLGPTGNVRTGLLEYGGGAWCVEAGVVTFAHWDDQRLHRAVADDPDAAPVPITPEPVTPRGLRYGDVTPLDASWVVAVREAHPGEAPAGGAPEPVHEIVAVPTDGSAADDPDAVVVLVSGPDFVAAPRPGPAALAWIAWDHPRMPWDGTELWVAGLALDGDGRPTVRVPHRVAGGSDEAIVGPEWDASGDLWCASDRSGWWNLHRVIDPRGEARVEPVGPVAAEIGGPRWVGGLRWYAPLGDGRILAAATASGATGLVVVDPTEPAAPPVPITVSVGDAPASVVGQVVAGPGPTQAAVVAASATAGPTVLLVDLGGGSRRRGRARLAVPLERAGDASASTSDGSTPAPTVVPAAEAPPARLDAASVARPEPFTFPTGDGEVAHGLLYRPRLAGVSGPDDARPPLVVTIHGGPTSAARPMFDLRTQFWTTRGFAVADVDHRGSTGYGRPFRRRLDGAWGEVDVVDCTAAARHLAAVGDVDPDRIVIRGGSAGGMTVLSALCSSDVFAGGTVLYGVTDLAALATDTHKFESRYLDTLVGPWPEAADVYAARSPVNRLDRLAAPILVLHGADDRVVPPAQAEAVVAAAARYGVRHEYRSFAGEGHGFRQAATIVEALEAELTFYREILDLGASG